MRVVLACLLASLACASTSWAAADEPGVRKGFGKIFYGLMMELPMTVADATLTSPPVVGTAVGLMAGITRAFRTTAEGLVEVSRAFDPWGTKQ